MLLIHVLFKTDGNPLWNIPPLPKHVSFTILIRSWLKPSLKRPSSSKACFSFNSDSKLMKILSEASFFFQCIFLIQVLCQIKEKSFWSIPLLPKHVSCLIIFHTWWTSSPKHPSSSNVCFLISSISICLEHPLWNIPLLPKHVSYSSHIRNRFWLPRTSCERRTPYWSKFWWLSHSIHIVWTRVEEEVAPRQQWYISIYI